MQAITSLGLQDRYHGDWAKAPSLKDLHLHIIPHYAADWREIGVLLGLQKGNLDSIEYNRSTDIECCCNKMLEIWLATKTTASWKELYGVIDSPAVSGGQAVIKVHSLLAKLYNDVTPKHAEKWKQIGEKLGLPIGKLNTIEAEWPTNFKRCCNRMLDRWLDVNTKPSWEKIDAVIQSLAVQHIQAPPNHEGTDPFSLAFSSVAKSYIQQRFVIDEKTWPPGQPTHYIEQNLRIYYQSQCGESRRESDPIPQSIQINPITLEDISYMHNSNHHLLQGDGTTKVTMNVAKIFSTLNICKCQKLILIEGTEGMGKTVLLKEITYRWANKQLLETFKLVILIRLQDPRVHIIESLVDLLQYFCKENCLPTTATENVVACSDKIYESNGKDIAFFFDSFEEIPKELQENSFISKIIKRKVLPDSVLVVSSLPHVSASLRQEATVTVHPLGFTKMEQKKQFIKQALKDQKQHITQVTQYLEQNSTISNLCRIPFNMTALLHLYRHGILFSNSSAKLHDHFITLTICRHLAKHGHPFEYNTYDLTNLPASCDKVFSQLCKLSLENVQREEMKMIFTLDEIKETCPNILESVTGFGLLQAVQNHCITGNTIMFSFVHFRFQEFLATHHIQMLDSQLKCIHFFYLLFKAGKIEMCRHIENLKIFESRAVNLRGKYLSPSDIEKLACLLTQAAHKEWEELDLHGCNICDRGIEILHQKLVRHNITINALSLSSNNLTPSSSSKICDITIHCKVKMLAIRENQVFSKDSKLYSIISHPDSMVEELNISETNCRLASTANELFLALEKNKKKKLRVLWINNNNITDDNCGAIVRVLQKNTSLKELNMHGNPINVITALRIVKALTYNNTLQSLVLPYYNSNDQKRITRLARKVDNSRYCKLDIYCHKPEDSSVTS